MSIGIFQVANALLLKAVLTVNQSLLVLLNNKNPFETCSQLLKKELVVALQV